MARLAYLVLWVEMQAQNFGGCMPDSVYNKTIHCQVSSRCPHARVARFQEATTVLPSNTVCRFPLPLESSLYFGPSSFVGHMAMTIMLVYTVRKRTTTRAASYSRILGGRFDPAKSHSTLHTVHNRNQRGSGHTDGGTYYSWLLPFAVERE
jgi:hypothetical protein